MTKPSFKALLNSTASRIYTSVCAVVPVKSRYFLTKNNRPRLRYAACGVAAVAMLGFGNADIGSNALIAYANAPTHGEDSLAELIAEQEHGQSPEAATSAITLAAADGAQQVAAAVVPKLKAKQETVKIDRGETLRAALIDAGLPRDDAQEIMNKVAAEYNMRELKAGQKFSVKLVPNPDQNQYQLASLTMKIDPIRTLNVSRDEDGSINAELDEKELKTVTRAARVVMDGTIYASADKAGLPDRITARAIKLFAHDVDFQRDVHSGDKLEVMFESHETKDGYIAKTGEIVYARMVIDGREKSLYRYKTDDGSYDYFDEDGKSVRRGGTGLLKTPVAYGHLTSGFGSRRHPILGYTKMHKGVDFGAPTGTPVYAAADGVIEKASRFSSYGNYVLIRHNSKLGTAYAHLSRYAEGIHPGTRVKQGETIGYVGTTGRSTGPHLHFEVHVNGVAVSPGSVKYASDNNLNGKDLKKFRQFVQNTQTEYVRRASSMNVASAKTDDKDSVQ